mgnify:CR=1 FL=1
MVQAIKRDEVYIEPEGIYVETQQPERRSRKPPLLLVHGALTGSWLWSSFGAFFAEIQAVNRGFLERLRGVSSRDPSANAVVILEGDTALLRLGDAEFVERLQQYLDLAPALRERMAGIDYVDLRFDERLYVRPQKPAAAVQARR